MPFRKDGNSEKVAEKQKEPREKTLSSHVAIAVNIDC